MALVICIFIKQTSALIPENRPYPDCLGYFSDETQKGAIRSARAEKDEERVETLTEAARTRFSKVNTQSRSARSLNVDFFCFR